MRVNVYVVNDIYCGDMIHVNCLFHADLTDFDRYIQVINQGVIQMFQFFFYL